MKPNQMYSEIKRFGLIFMPINWLVCLTVTLVLFFTVHDEGWWTGYLLGSVASFLTFGLQMKAVGYPDEAKGSKVRKVYGSYPVRFLFSALILGIAFYSTYYAKGTFLEGTINLYATFIGLVVIKFLLIIFSIVLSVIDKKKEKPVVKKEEASMTVQEMAEKLDKIEETLDEGGIKQ